MKKIDIKLFLTILTFSLSFILLPYDIFIVAIMFVSSGYMLGLFLDFFRLTKKSA